MKKFATLTLGALSLVALASGCAVDIDAPQEEGVATAGEALTCNNEEAVNSVMAEMATAAAVSIGRWLPDRDFVLTSNGLALSQWGAAKCNAPGRSCARIVAALDLQNWAMHGTIFGGQPLDVGVLRSRIASNWQAQMTCINRPDNNANDNCPWQQHELEFLYDSPGNCGTDKNFKAWVGNTNPPRSQLLAYPQQLKNMLLWAGYPANPYLNFQADGYDVRIDPPILPPPPDGGGSGSCEQLVQYSSGACQSVLSAVTNSRNIGDCCKCGTGGNMTWQWKRGMPPYKYYECYAL